MLIYQFQPGFVRALLFAAGSVNIKLTGEKVRLTLKTGVPVIYQHKIKLTEKEVYDILAEYLCQRDAILKKAKNEEKIMSGGFQQIGFFGECLAVPTETFELMFELEDGDS